MEREEIDYSEDSRLRILFLIPGPALETPPRFNGAGPLPFFEKPTPLEKPCQVPFPGFVSVLEIRFVYRLDGLVLSSAF